MNIFAQKYEDLMQSLADLPSRIADQEELVEDARRAVAQAETDIEAAEAALMQSVQGSNAEQRKAALTLRKQSDVRYQRVETNRRDYQDVLAQTLTKQRQLENRFRAVCYQAMLTAAFWQLPGLKLPTLTVGNGQAQLEEAVDALGL